MITLQRKKLKCTCGDPIFTGIPCRYLLVVATKQKEIDFDSLPFKVWKKNYYKDEPEPEGAFPKEEEEKKKFKNEEKKLMNLI